LRYGKANNYLSHNKNPMLNTKKEKAKHDLYIIHL